MFCGPSSLQQRKPLSSKQALELADICLNHARQAKDSDSSSIWCDEAEAALSQIKKTAKGNTSAQKEGRTLSDGIGAAYACLSELQHTLGKSTKADINGRKAGQWGTQTPPKPKSVQPSHGQSSLAGEDAVPFPQNIFPHNISPPNILRHLPEADERLDSTAQLAYCLGLLQVVQAQDDETSIRQWVRDVVNDVDEHDRLRMLATDVIRAFKRDELKGTEAITEVVLLAPVLQRDDFRSLLKEFFSGIEHADLLNIHQLDGLSRLIQGARPVDLDSDDLVKILSLLSSRLRHVHRQSQHHIYQLTLAVSNVLDAMADTKVRGLDRETLHEPLAAYLEGLKGSSDPYLVYQAAYAFQALQCVPDNETLWQATLRRTGKVIQGVSGLASAVKGFDLNKFMEGLGDIQQGLGGVSRAVQVAQAAYKDVASLAQGGMNFLDSLKEGLSFERKRAWYPALRGASVLIQEGQLANFRILVCEGPCRRDPAFQWGVCQRLGEIALDQAWDADVRKRAVDFLGDIYRNDLVWGQNANVKQWILDILIQIAASSTLSGSTAECT
ncbi:hypothetical protein BGX31_006850 [Mortierella sp. GBA43]|nr:hypothetical protein BGX31_006850 [Mortierella sp. GBA43]